MLSIPGLFLALGLVASSPSNAKGPCAVQAEGSLAYPWMISDVMPGDRWAEVYMSIDEHGFPTGCEFGKNNIRNDNDRFYVCLAFMDQWRAMASARASHATKVKRLYLSYGSKHRKAERQAEVLYFQNHPDDRPNCYREPF